MNNVKCFALFLVLLCGIIGLSAQTPDWQWAVRAGGAGVDCPRAIDVDEFGNQYIIGHFEGTASFGSYTLNSVGSNDIFVAKLDTSGNYLWAVRTGGTGYDRGNGIAVDGVGNAYLTGWFYGTAEFGTYTLNSSGERDIFAAKLDPDGNFLWAIRAGSATDDEGSAIAVDAAGNAWLAGTFTGVASFGPFSLISYGPGDIFAAKLNTAGNFFWAQRAGGTGFAGWDEGSAIAVDSDGNSFLTGFFSGTADFGPYTLNSAGSFDIFVAKLDPFGSFLWTHRAGGTGEDKGNAIAVDGAGNAFLTGYFLSTADFGLFELNSAGNYDIFVTKLDPFGNFLWAHRAGGTGFDRGYGVATDIAGNTYLTGHFWYTADFGSFSLNSAGCDDIYAAKLDPDGNFLWAIREGGGSSDYGCDIAADGAGDVYLTGFFWSIVSFGSFFLSSVGNSDIFAAKLGSGSPIDDTYNPPVSSLTLSTYPNPFRRGETATIKANIAECGGGTLSIFNLRGQCVAVHQLSSGEQQITLDSRELPTGIYLCKLKTRDACISKKLVLLK